MLKKILQSLIGETKIETKDGLEKIILVKPQTYMNLSGESVLCLKNKFKIKTEDIFIVCDDIDLPIGSYRYREKGSAGTHNGLRNIIHLLNDFDFKRIRIGIGRDYKMDLSDYVLSKMSKDNEEKISLSIDHSIDFLLKELKIKTF